MFSKLPAAITNVTMAGYPDGLAGKEIPVHARIVAMADSYDAMSSRRIYRSALSVMSFTKRSAKTAVFSLILKSPIYS